MSALLLILLSAVLVNVMALTRMPSWRPFEAVTGTLQGAQGLAIASLIAIPVVAAIAWSLSSWLLEPNALGYLRTFVFVIVAVAVVPLVEFALRRDGRLQPQRPGFTLLVTTNSAVLGIALMVDARMQNIVDAVAFSIAMAVALGFLMLAFAAMHDRLQHADVPKVFRDAPLALVSAGIMALAFMGFTGLIQE
ncbi:electron transport complex protein RnfA [Peristeroidobacter agariperforans]|uniref:electron transport complex protein RnfA n=1 Tax=Peristeroidobacter agariperforans TaxID=268404 RepID=UPI00101CDB4A|nr:Rnf-Nqr domain containing protein [Peristeroidobacter agariperforans]